MNHSTTTGSLGATPLPLSSAGSPVRVTFEIPTEVQDVQATQRAAFPATRLDDPLNGSLVHYNDSFLAYAVKNGLIRILHIGSSGKTLLRSHEGQTVTDLQFFQQNDILASVGARTTTAAAATTASATPTFGPSSLMVSRVSLAPSGEIYVEVLLEFRTEHFIMSRVLWHPFDMNQLCLIHTDPTGLTVGTLINSNSIHVRPSPQGGHNCCVFASDHVIKEGAVQIRDTGHLNDLQWSPTYLLSVHDSGNIILHDSKKVVPGVNSMLSYPTTICIIEEEETPSRCLWLPHTSAGTYRGTSTTSTTVISTCFLTASQKNACITLWSPFTNDGKPPTKLQVVTVANPSPSYLLGLCTPPHASFSPHTMVVMADRHTGSILAWHLKASYQSEQELVLWGFDYVVPFRSKFPTFSWQVQTKLSLDTNILDNDIGGEDDHGNGMNNNGDSSHMNDSTGSNIIVFDIELNAYQKSYVQTLTLSSIMLLPPAQTWTDPTPGVTVERLWPNIHSAHVSEVDSENLDYDEEYDVEYEDAAATANAASGEDDDDDEDFNDGIFDDENHGPDASALPTPGFAGLSSGSNPFTNWLGSLAAAKPTFLAPQPKTSLPPPAPQPALPPPVTTTTSLPTTMEVVHTVSASLLESELPPDPAIIPIRDLSDLPPPPPPPPPANMLPPRLPVAEPATTGSGSRAPTPPASNVSRSSMAGVVASTIDKEEMIRDIRGVIRNEFETSLATSVAGAVREAVRDSLIQPLQSSVNELSQTGVQVDPEKLSSALASSIDLPLRAAFANHMKSALLPAVETMVGQVLEQVSEHMEKQMVLHTTAADTHRTELNALNDKLATMTDLLANLTKEMESLRGIVETRPAPSPQPAPAPAQTNASKEELEGRRVKTLITQYCNLGQFENAFTVAFQKQAWHLTLLCCKLAPLNVVLDSDKPQINQPIQLCIMQHLAQVILASKDNSEIDLALKWLQELALTLNPPEPEIRAVVPRVIDELQRNINTRLKIGDQAHRQKDFFRLLQFVRGIQI